jgi:hypothetical protein
MSSEGKGKVQTALPLLLRFARLLPDQPIHLLRYDAKRQIAETFVAGRWVDANEAREAEASATRITRVRAETTDDE